MKLHEFLDLVYYYVTTEYEISEEALKNFNKLWFSSAEELKQQREKRLTITQSASQLANEAAYVPPWWGSDEEITQNNLQAMRQLR